MKKQIANDLPQAQAAERAKEAPTAISREDMLLMEVDALRQELLKARAENITLAQAVAKAESERFRNGLQGKYALNGQEQIDAKTGEIKRPNP